MRLVYFSFAYPCNQVINEHLSLVNMHGVRRTLSQFCRELHKLSCDGPSDTLKRKVAELGKERKRIPRKNKLYVVVPESRKYLDTATMPMVLTVVGTALFVKLLMMVLFKFVLVGSMNNGS